MIESRKLAVRSYRVSIESGDNLMTTIAVSRSLADALGKATQPIRLVDDQGKLLGSFAPAESVADDANALSAEEISELKRRMSSAGPWYTTDEVLAYIQSLEQR
jgi:hypothetical protein